MSGTVPPDAQGRWRGQRGRASRGPTRTPLHPPMPLPDELPADSQPIIIEEDEVSPQKGSSGGSGGIGGPKSPPAGPKTDPPPNPPPSE